MKTELDHLPERKQQELQTITKIFRDTLEEYITSKTGIKSEFRILKIILFGSHAKGTWVRDLPNGYISDYDILVIVNKPSMLEDHVIWQRASEQIARHVTSAPLGLIVHTLKEVNEQLKQGHYFFRDIREEGIEIFSGDPRELALPGNLSPEEAIEVAQKHFKYWFSKAVDRFELYEFSINKKKLPQSAFLLHQATESLFACFLLVSSNYLPKSHDIEKLRAFCAERNLAFADIFPMDSKFHRRSFRRLQKAYVDARYSEHYEITEEELEYLQAEVQKLQQLVENACLEFIA